MVKEGANNMEYVTLNNGVKMPLVGFGVFQIQDKEACIKCVQDAIKAGYRLIDTAQSYGNEEAVGEAIKTSSIPREELFITTKVWISNAGYEKAKASILASLEKMQLDYLDLMLIHQPLSDYYGTYRAMEELYKEGKLKAIGVSNFYPDRLTDIALFSEIKPAVNQVEVNVFQQQIEAQAIMEKHGVQIESWAPFAEGKQDMFTNPTLQAIGDKHQKTIAQVILRWQLQRGIVSLAKTTSFERMQENINIFDFELSAEEMATIQTLDKKESSFFNHQDAAVIERLASLVR